MLLSSFLIMQALVCICLCSHMCSTIIGWTFLALVAACFVHRTVKGKQLYMILGGKKDCKAARI